MSTIIESAPVSIVLALVLGAGALAAARLSSALVHRIWRAGYDPDRHLAMALTLLRFALLLAAGAASISLLAPIFEGLSTSSALLIGGAMLLAAYPLLQNMLAGLYLVARGDVREGDRIHLGSTTGMIREVGLGRVRLREDDGTSSLIPNRLLLQEPIQVQRASGRARIEVLLSDQGVERADLARIREVAHLCPYRVAATPVLVGPRQGGVQVEIQTWRPRCHEEVLDYLEAALRPRATAPLLGTPGS